MAERRIEAGQQVEQPAEESVEPQAEAAHKVEVECRAAAGGKLLVVVAERMVEHKNQRCTRILGCYREESKPM